MGSVMHWQLPLALPHGIAQLVHGRNALVVIDIVQANKQVGVFKHDLLVAADSGKLIYAARRAQSETSGGGGKGERAIWA